MSLEPWGGQSVRYVLLEIHTLTWEVSSKEIENAKVLNLNVTFVFVNSKCMGCWAMLRDFINLLVLIWNLFNMFYYYDLRAMSRSVIRICTSRDAHLKRLHVKNWYFCGYQKFLLLWLTDRRTWRLYDRPGQEVLVGESSGLVFLKI